MCRNGLSGTCGKGRFVDGGQEGLALFSGEAVLALVSNCLIATVMSALYSSPFDLASLTGNSGTFLGRVVLGSRLGTDLVEPYIPEIAVRLFGLEAYGECSCTVRKQATENKR